MRKFFQRFAAIVLFLGATFIPFAPVIAQTPAGSTPGVQFSLLPQTTKNLSDCNALMATFEAAPDVGATQSSMLKGTAGSDTLGCAIKTGKITFSMIPYFVTYVTNFLLGLSGLISVLFIVIGGYHYVIGGLSEEKEKGKQTIMHALMGMGVSLLAWTIVTVLINAVTG